MKTGFKLLAESVGCTIDKMALLLQIPAGTARKYASGERTMPAEVLNRIEAIFRQIELAAHTFRHHPERLGRTGIPRVLHRAIRRRIQEINIVEAGKVK